ncbi:hypothetical protein [Desulfopila aestuarii]|uniref:Uncharacterized protein n=1 Tax=Desulfopila aestuarii DSM 18488 TaxID=1121416 RepID=A0A1M7XZ60_9BACT|nr:hypothetical protein [Desulfopila aestuarii]SHO44179.1 hypothetical protein SAMN02745220_00686 [Desulfopila aestuarii DSM 18488]
MNDFLTRMARYSRGEVDLVTPVLPGLFGPQSESEPVATAMDISVPQGKGTQPDNEAAIPAVAGKGEILRQPVVHKGAKTEQSPVADNASLPPDREGDAQYSNAQKAMSGSAPVAELHDPAVFPSTVESQIQPVTVIRSISLAEKGLWSASALDNSEVVPAAEMRLVNQAPVATIEDSALLVPQERSTSLPIEAQAVSQHDMAQLTTSFGQDTQKEQAIHITIGRIDVRARTPAPVSVARTSRSKSASSLSLSAYLKRGGGGS